MFPFSITKTPSSPTHSVGPVPSAEAGRARSVSGAAAHACAVRGGRAEREGEAEEDELQEQLEAAALKQEIATIRRQLTAETLGVAPSLTSQCSSSSVVSDRI